IHPTGVALKENLKQSEWKIYELVFRRFLATLSPFALLRDTSLEIEVKKELFVIRGVSILKEGWLKVYPYGQRKEEITPNLSKGEEVTLLKTIVEEKETQPPIRYTQGQLIKEMEKLSLGTKSTRHEIIKNLYDRKYVHGDPIIPTDMGIAVAEALMKYANKITTPEMTAELERDMDAVAEGKFEREKVVNRSRDMLGEVMLSLLANESQVSEEIWEGIKEGKVIGKCPVCGKDLKIIRARKTNKRFVGCTSYPECSTSYPLPQKGEIIPLDEVCEVCGAPKVKIIFERGKPWILCINMECPSKTEEAGKKSSRRKRVASSSKKSSGS
ncbi:MAG: DNA topoisomerase, partial [Candidatus Subteraquimicrobiales bacterium]|nr:DNA topoisomerase [Candidatus Subteraquimicrobiales bacterium]